MLIPDIMCHGELTQYFNVLKKSFQCYTAVALFIMNGDIPSLISIMDRASMFGR